MKFPKTLGLSIALLERRMIAAQEPEMRGGCPMGVKILAVLALALGAAGAFAQNDPVVQEPKVAPIMFRAMPIASLPANARTITGEEVMNFTSPA